jgi:putative ABC transport system permease protein
MMFIILSLSVGLFSAGAARTLNRNAEDRVRNDFGADIVVRQHWVELGESGFPVINAVSVSGLTAGTSLAETVSYMEPPFIEFQMLEGADSVARVLQLDTTRVRFLGRNSAVTFIAFDPYEFANTTWWRSDLAPHKLNDYMSMMIDYPGTAVLSESLRDELGLREGDKISVYRFACDNTIELEVLAFVPYWPSFSPFIHDSSGAMVKNHLIAANFDYVFAQIPQYPYDIWIRKAQGVSDLQIYDRLAEMRTPFKSIETITKPMVEAKNDPVLQSTNGALSLGFIISMMICGIGFLIYWILSINSRTMHFGAMRAIGMSRRKILYMLVLEQILISGVALIVGVAIGNLAVYMYVPVFTLLYSGIDQSIPFRVFLSAGDSIRVYIIFAVMLLCCMAVLTRMIKRINIDRALKMGED